MRYLQERTTELILIVHMAILINCIALCTALVLFSRVCALGGNSAAIRILHVFSAGYDAGEAALSVDVDHSNVNGSLLQDHNITVTEVQDVGVSK